VPNPAPTRYHDAKGVQHQIVVRRAPDGVWEVFDVSSRQSTLVDSLTAADEGRPQAEAIAREYARDQREHATTRA
jgi:hypothetical protein